MEASVVSVIQAYADPCAPVPSSVGGQNRGVGDVETGQFVGEAHPQEASASLGRQVFGKPCC